MIRRDGSSAARAFGEDARSRGALRFAMLAAMLFGSFASSACNFESARLPDGSRISGKPYRVEWRFALAQAAADFRCPESRIWSTGLSRVYDFRFSGCGQSGRYSCTRHERRADLDIEQELDHVWEVVYVCRRLPSRR